MKTRSVLVLAGALLAWAATVPTAWAQPPAQDDLQAMAATTDWQLRRLMQPTEAERASESAGEIMIYDGLTDKQVDEAMTQHFHRIPNMMFVGTIVTDDEGEPFHDPVGGGFIQQDDGC